MKTRRRKEGGEIKGRWIARGVYAQPCGGVCLKEVFGF